MGIVIAGERGISSASAALTGVGLIGSLGIAIAFVGFNMRINRRFWTFSLDPVPKEYFLLRRRWDLVHAARTVSSLVAFSASTLAARI